MSGSVEKSSIEGLPKQFVTSLRILFDILDEEGAGYVRLCDIESRWHEEGVRGLPSGVIDTLRKVAPHTGKLSFENFVTGLKYSLLKNASSNAFSSHVQNGKENKGPPQRQPITNKPISAQSQIRIGRQGQNHHQTQWAESTQNQAQHHNGQRTQQGKNIAHSRPLSSAVKPNNAASTNISQNVELRNQIYNREQIQQAAKHRSKSEVTYRNQNHKTDMQDMYKNHDANLYNRLQEKPPTNMYNMNANNVTYRLQQKQKDDQPKVTFSVSQKPKVDEVHIPKTEEIRQPRDIVKMRHNEQSNTVFAVQPRPKSQEIYTTKHEENQHQQSRDFVQIRLNERQVPQRPQRPPPYNSAISRLQEHKPPTLPPRDTNSRIMRELKSWQKEHKNMSLPSHNLPTVSSDSKLMEMNRLSGDEIYVNIEEIRKQQELKAKSTPSINVPQKATVRRQNSRRHTLSSGVDYNMIRRAKQLEQERDVLLQGLEVVAQTQDWYRKQLARISEKQNYVGKTSHTEGTLSANQERMDFQRARITEVNTHLNTLMETSEKGFPAHMNLAVRTSAISPESAITMLKTQNKQLTKEVGNKGEKITQLEKEKASLIRDLFESRSKHKTSYDDTTFM